MISVVIPVYNGEKTIRETIESVLTQNFKDIEIIVINDGSNDSTLEIIKSIADSRIQIFTYTNAGLAASRNRGIYHASGEYISFIDADDLWTPDKLESQWQVLRENPASAVAYSWTDYINESGKICKSGRRIIANGEVFEQLLLFNFLENGSNPLIRTQVFKEIGDFDESLLASEDRDMWLRLAVNYEFACVEKVQILYRISPNSMSANLKKQEVETLKVIERFFAHPKAASLQHLKKYSLSYLYKYLLFKALETPVELQQSWKATQFWWKCVKNDPSVLKQRRVMLIALVKIAFPEIINVVKKIAATSRERN
ncbi:glycosyltransferase [Anabaena sp. WFMT]|uniref:glycosyltransferase n=1 Tax=Anabaena sp. WFMT TaxID=3449730 RepID=UPI003F29523A